MYFLIEKLPHVAISVFGTLPPFCDILSSLQLCIQQQRNAMVLGIFLLENSIEARCTLHVQM